ncbi:hypothetical protein PHYBLDRAFT_68407 [Phycomyces blakesleeanus NRRL 1555(-)]|uniref:Uncharacterized protein n=1 Tax=Phycomyces blakesleeanus (strain ATCC 8743b / DSM 1359 / FGSC 10004 / NBRC 33097 / NRRL 1555) TaxID=763407 RepID=A0A167PJQ9_PHYB8|nr:hypothetical protein PHYBLDRAFT_68407 [Phycomyces blakesleeanus NRRL 1555(-)]OAD78089.1 hypothetical protein PHYBLDRAFT_68407 [Phycomyces blakesleeanus NRRL 1555(-)]|eukprot:XP_018296129.1 hypothetical protein PHYBLDRAFT_68407 [Phycomyces blakesleeanus NRRL 1555(-)]
MHITTVQDRDRDRDKDRNRKMQRGDPCIGRCRQSEHQSTSYGWDMGRVFLKIIYTNEIDRLSPLGLLWWLKLKKFLRGKIEDLRLRMKICENLCRFCLLRKDLVSKFDEVPTLNYYCYLYYSGSGKLYDWGQSQ